MTSAFIRRRLRRLRPRRERPAERVALVLCVAFLIAGTAWSIEDNNHQIKVAGVTIIAILLGSLVLGTRAMLALAGCVVASLCVVFAIHGLNASQLSVSGFVMISVALLVAVAQAVRRDRLGLKQMSAEKVLALIRDRLRVQSQLPEIGSGWLIEVAQRPADGAAIAGDFVSTRLVCAAGTRVVHVAVIDVSGSGIAAGPRALLLSGAVGGLLGSVPPEDFLPATNDYLARQRWSLGFASAVYVQLDLGSGAYEIRAAGHPPAMHFRPSAQPPWRTSPASGTVLGVLPSVGGCADRDVLGPGEALLLYTDGLVEDRSRDIDDGTARLRQAVQARVDRDQWAGFADELIDRVPTASTDDRTLVIIRREPAGVSDGPVNAPDRRGAADSELRMR